MIGNRFGAGAKGGPFHIYISAAIMDASFESARRLEQQLAQFLTNRIRKRDVANDAAPEKRVRIRLLGAVQKLVGQNDIARLVLCLKRTDGAHANNPGDAELLHAPDV